MKLISRVSLGIRKGEWSSYFIFQLPSSPPSFLLLLTVIIRKLMQTSEVIILPSVSTTMLWVARETLPVSRSLTIQEAEVGETGSGQEIRELACLHPLER